MIRRRQKRDTTTRSRAYFSIKGSKAFIKTPSVIFPVPPLDQRMIFDQERNQYNIYMFRGGYLEG